ncbi:MAG TPA: hypothetical protein DEF43_01895 [Chloroflexus aurantiacus]|nr:hypothetical protein [Chloroflexus aurantiacus]
MLHIIYASIALEDDKGYYRLTRVAAIREPDIQAMRRLTAHHWQAFLIIPDMMFLMKAGLIQGVYQVRR